MMVRCITFMLGWLLISAFLTASAGVAASPPPAKTSESEVQQRQQRLALFVQMSAVTHVPWEILAAIERYERTMARFAKPRPPERLIQIHIPERIWSGSLNPQTEDINLTSISFFGGMGRDGSADGQADRSNGADLLRAISEWILQFGTTDDDIKIALWHHYRNERAVKRIMQFATLYRSFGTLDLGEAKFPLPVGSHYTYRGTWGAARGWGGRRIHEGTDLFAPYGLPVRSTCYGIIETKGWNDYGGWRIGIRDANNVYHYFAHLGGFQRALQVGDTVKPGEVIGWVGSSGYGKPGTSGKFPPHLHYGTYRDHGYSDWAFDPYPKLRASEQAEQRAKTNTNRTKRH